MNPDTGWDTETMTISMSDKRLVVITGCSGGGKSTLISELAYLGYTVVPEVGREIVKEQLKINGDVLPWKKPKQFCEALIERSIAAYHNALQVTPQKDKIIFFDRCFLEGISYYQTLKFDDSNKYDHFITDLRYYSTLLMVPPWKEIWCQDSERKHSFEDAVEEYNRLLKFYASHDYKVIEIPKDSINKRIEFVISVFAQENT